MPLPRIFTKAFSRKSLSKKISVLILISVVYFGYVYTQSEAGTTHTFDLANGYCVETITTEKACHSWVVLHGTSLYNKGTLGFFYFLFLIYLFLGIAIVADIFMGAIEVITSKEVDQVLLTDDGARETIKVKVWNPTIANLTLMALGSSAPEILLSVIETVTTLSSTPGELGASTIVGSAAFNLLGKTKFLQIQIFFIKFPLNFCKFLIRNLCLIGSDFRYFNYFCTHRNSQTNR